MVEAVDCRLLYALVSSSFVEAVDCCRLLCAIEGSNFVEAVESVVVKAVDCCRLLCALFLLKLLNLFLLKKLIVVGYYVQ